MEELPGSSGHLLGDTDSERYFVPLQHNLREAPDAITGIRKAVDWVKENYTYVSLNFLLADGDSLYALRLPETNGLFVRRLEAEEDLRGSSSYGTRTEGRHRSEAILFASEKIDSAPAWRELEPGTLAVARRDLRLEMYRV